MNNDIKSKDISSGTIEDIEQGVGILEKLAKIFISIFSIFKSKNPAEGRD
jgi:hypothetical protein